MNSLISFLCLLLLGSSHAFSNFLPPALHRPIAYESALQSTDDDDNTNDEAERLKSKAEELREQIRKMEEQLGGTRKRNYDIPQPPPQEQETAIATGKSLRKKRVLVVGANGRLGSMVCRYLLRNNPETEVVAAVHYVGENSPTARGYGRLSYEVGAEDGVGNIGAAWSAEDRVATFQYSDEMKDYNLQNLRLVEVELLDPVQCETICEGVDSIVWCATDFNGNQPRAVSGLNIAFLFRAVADPTKGRVEIEGLQNMLGALKKNLQDRKWKSGGKDMSSPNDPINFVHVSQYPGIYRTFETPFGEFNAIKRQGEGIVANDFPSLTYTILKLAKFEDNFVEEGLEILTKDSSPEDEPDENSPKVRINRRDAARAVAKALTDETLQGRAVKVWTATRG